MIDIPTMNQRIIIQTATPEGDESTLNQQLDTWTDAMKVWCNIQPVSGREALIARQLRAMVSHVVTIGYLGTFVIDSTMRLKYGDRIFNVDGVFDVDERNFIYKVYCTERKGEIDDGA